MSMMHVGLAQWIGANVPGLDYLESAGGNVFVDNVPSAPNRLVAVLTEGGPEADAKLGYDSPMAEILIRSDSASPAWALDTWRALYDAIHALRHVELPDGTMLVYALAVQSSPNRIGTDDNGRHQYSLNVRTEVRNPTARRPA